MPVSCEPLPINTLPVTLPAADINPPVSKLPVVVLAVTVSAPSVPTDVIFVCAAVVNVPTMLVPDKLPPVILPVALINPAVRKLPPVILPTALSANPPVFDTTTVVLAGNVTLPVPSVVPMVMIVFELATPAVPMLMFLV